MDSTASNSESTDKTTIAQEQWYFHQERIKRNGGDTSLKLHDAILKPNMKMYFKTVAIKDRFMSLTDSKSDQLWLKRKISKRDIVFQ